MPIDFKVVTPYGVGYEDEVEKVTIPTTTGAITVHETHAPLISILEPGEMNIHKLDGSVVNLAVTGGFLEVRSQSRVYIMADTAERAEEIDIEQAQRAIERAQELLKQQDQLADIDFAKLQAQIEREMARISVGKKYRNAK
ncbi:ATP synthase F1 subunit epsilon [Candidatus Nomurabacteria bacterium]|nr:ATP synthase F1 subunit epsilon [Candidatus Nomurabacteria bacterium]